MVPYFLQRGHEVVGLDAEYYSNGSLFAPPEGYIHLLKDVRDVQMEELVGFEAIVHLAALSNDPLGDLNPELTYDINYRATIRLAQLAREAGVPRFLYASSCSLYGAAGDRLLDESAPMCPLTSYAESKVRSEDALSKLADTDFAPVYLRNATAYGASPRLRLDIVLNNLMGWAVTTGTIRITSDGTPWRPMAHVEDIAQAFACVLQAPLDVICNQAFNVGANNENYQVRELASFVRETVGDCNIEYANQTGPDPRNYRVDFSKLAQMLPTYSPRWSARTGARELFEAYRTAGMTTEDFQGRRFTRLKQLRFLLEDRQVDNNLRWVSRPQLPTTA